MSDRTPEQRAADRREIEKLHPGERFRLMLDASDTPETDEYIGTHETHRINGLTIYDRAKQLERERDEARSELSDILETYRNTIKEPCDNGQQHCTCVPALREEIRKLSRVAELEGARWEAVHSGGHWWIAEEKTGDLIEMIAGPESEIAEAIVRAHNLTLGGTE